MNKSEAGMLETMMSSTRELVAVAIEFMDTETLRKLRAKLDAKMREDTHVQYGLDVVPENLKSFQTEILKSLDDAIAVKCK